MGGTWYRGLPMAIAFTHAKSATAAAARAAARDTSSDGAASDQALINRIAGGDQLAMRTLYARHRIPLYRWLLRIVGNETVAEDLLSDVFLDVWRQAASFEGRASVSTWLFAIARYKAFSALRARIDTELDERITSTITDPADTPEAALQEKNRGELVRESLAKLSPEHREVIDLVYYHGKTVKEVAEIVGVGEATVKTRMFYARRKLASLVAAG
jgi:RNA polymerase sigma-70 factor, ECF subfamily